MKNEYTFKMEAFTPETLPMARCADYLCELAAMLGESTFVHFVELRSGCTEFAYSIDHEAVPKVEERVETIKRGEGTIEEMRAYRKINSMLREDNGKGSISVKNRGEIIRFPGVDDKKLRLASIKQTGKVDGELIRVGGAKNEVNITLAVDGVEVSGFHTKREIAKRMAKNLFESVRVYGEGRWERTEDGEWNLKTFRVESFEVLRESNLDRTIAELRALKGEWGEDAIKEILDLRHSN